MNAKDMLTNKELCNRRSGARFSRTAVWACSAAVGVAFAVVVALMCRHGAEVPFVDSLNYFRFSQTAQWQDLPVIHGIGYALYLAVFARVFSTLQAATAGANVVAGFAFGTVFCWWMVRRFGGKGILVALAALSNLALLADYGAALSEGFFLACLMASFAALDVHERTVRKPWLAISCVFMAISCLTRYAGVAFGGIACLSMWLADSKRVRGFGRACVYGMACIAPLIAVMAVNRFFRGSATAHAAGFHPAGLNEWADGCSTICSWLVPDRIWVAFPLLTSVVGLAVLAGCLLAGIRGIAKRDRETMIWSFAILGHVLFLWLSYTFVDCDLAFNRRLLSPMVPFLFFGLACLLERVPRFGRVAMIAVFAYLVCFNVQRAIPFVRERCENGAGWWGKQWDISPVVNSITARSRTMPVYSNASTALEFRGCANIRSIPWEELPVSGEGNGQFEEDYAACIDELKSGRAVLGEVNFAVWFKRTVPLERIVADAGLEKLEEFIDGTIWGRPGAWE